MTRGCSGLNIKNKTESLKSQLKIEHTLAHGVLLQRLFQIVICGTIQFSVVCIIVLV